MENLDGSILMGVAAIISSLTQLVRAAGLWRRLDDKPHCRNHSVLP